MLRNVIRHLQANHLAKQRNISVKHALDLLNTIDEMLGTSHLNEQERLDKAEQHLMQTSADHELQAKVFDVIWDSAQDQ